jgi:hypothetical protein
MTLLEQPIAWRLSGAPSPWGDYGNILINGMSTHLPRSSGRIQLERTGPFVPPISFPVVAVVTDVIRMELERQGLTGITFQDVRLARIVRLDWEKWDRTADLPQYPVDGEPESLIVNRPHDEELAARMGPLWELVPAKWGTASTTRVSRKPLKYRALLTPERDVPMPDVFRAAGTGLAFTFVSPRAREWFAQRLGEWVQFESVERAEDCNG